MLAESLRFDLSSDLGYRYPGAEDEEAMRKLIELCEAGFQNRYSRRSGRDQARARLEEELRIIETLNLPGFFLLHHDLLELAREVAVEVEVWIRPARCCRLGAAGARASPRSSAT